MFKLRDKNTFSTGTIKHNRWCAGFMTYTHPNILSRNRWNDMARASRTPISDYELPNKYLKNFGKQTNANVRVEPLIMINVFMKRKPRIYPFLMPNKTQRRLLWLKRSRMIEHSRRRFHCPKPFFTPLDRCTGFFSAAWWIWVGAE